MLTHNAELIMGSPLGHWAEACAWVAARAPSRRHTPQPAAQVMERHRRTPRYEYLHACLTGRHRFHAQH
jgi:hypothetical protein